MTQLTESQRNVLRAEREHAHCIRRWEELRQVDPEAFRQAPFHGWEAHLPSPVVDWRKNASNT